MVGVSSGLPAARASSCAAATASWLFRVSLLKSTSAPRCGVSGGPVDTISRLYDRCTSAISARSSRSRRSMRPRRLQLVLQAEHLLDAGEVEPELGRQPLDRRRRSTSASE